jgi:hypothetical protein
MTNGSITLNGITDHDLVIVFEFKERHEGKLFFNPQQMQVAQNSPAKSQYNNVILTWQNHAGLEVVMELLHRLSPETPCHHHEEALAA